MTNLLSVKRQAPWRLITILTGPFRSKYAEIILAVGLFILLDTGVLIINFYTSFQIANDAHAIQLASRMGTLSQSLLHELYQVQEDLKDPEADYNKTIDVLAGSYKKFDETLDAFIYGSELIGTGQGKDALLKDTVYRDTSSHLLTETETIWKVYRTRLKPIVYSYYNELERQEIQEAAATAISFARLNSDQLLDYMQTFSIAIEEVATRKAERLRMIQSIGITLAVINFFLILFHFLRRLKRSDSLVERSRKETENILQNVNEGLFLLDRDYVIGSQHSVSLHDFFQKETLAGQNFIDLLSRIVSEKTLDNVKEYTDLLFSRRVNESLVSDLNPLDQVEINLATDVAVFDTRYFSFQFSRVYESKEFDTLLVTVKDITSQVQLAEKLKVANKKSSREIDMLLEIIHVDNSMLTDFLHSAEEGLNEVNQILKKSLDRSEHPRDKLDSISRIVHKIKGDGTSVGLDFMVEKIHRFEQLIAELHNQSRVNGEDFLPLVVNLKQLFADFYVIRKLQGKMSTLDLSGFKLQPAVLSPANQSVTSAPEGYAPSHSWQKQMQTLVESIAKDYEKQADLDMSDFDATLLSSEQAEPVKDIVIQSLRNAIAHGIESPEVRENSGKSREGNLKVALKRNGSALHLSIRDDGQGLNLEKIKLAAMERGFVSEEQLASMSRSSLLSLIFKQGVSTAEEGGIHAGQGVGMDLVKNRIDSLKGQIRLKYQSGKYTEFQYKFEPVPALVN